VALHLRTFVAPAGGTAQWAAVSCAHCALAYGVVAGLPQRAFVCLPRSVLACEVSEAGFVRADPACFRCPLPTCLDFAVAKVARPRPRVTQRPLVWPPTARRTPTPACRSGALVGAAKAGVVLGDGPLEHHDGALVFVARQREPGNSGTVMCGTTAHARPAPVGIYCGTLGCAKSGMRTRCRICAFPRHEDIEWSLVVDPRAKSTSLTVFSEHGYDDAHLRRSKGVTFLRGDNVRLRAPGIVMLKELPFICRPKPGDTARRRRRRLPLSRLRDDTSDMDAASDG